jgi:hypothetical protein
VARFSSECGTNFRLCRTDDRAHFDGLLLSRMRLSQNMIITHLYDDHVALKPCSTAPIPKAIKRRPSSFVRCAHCDGAKVRTAIFVSVLYFEFIKLDARYTGIVGLNQISMILCLVFPSIIKGTHLQYMVAPAIINDSKRSRTKLGLKISLEGGVSFVRWFSGLENKTSKKSVAEYEAAGRLTGFRE